MNLLYFTPIGNMFGEKSLDDTKFHRIVFKHCIITMTCVRLFFTTIKMQIPKTFLTPLLDIVICCRLKIYVQFYLLTIAFSSLKTHTMR